MRSPSPSLLAALLTSVASFVPSTALGQGCPVVVTGEEHSAWRAATSDLEDALGEGPGDCAYIELVVRDGRAHLRFVTDDGRSTDRVLEHPADIEPTVRALAVTVPDGALPERLPVETPATSTPPTPARAERTPDEDRSPHGGRTPRPPVPLTPLFAVQLGGRGGADDLITSTLMASAAVALGAWELGLTGGFEFQYFDLADEGEAERRSSAMAVGVSVGRRERIGDILLLGGGRLLAVSLQHRVGDGGRAEGRVAGYVGLSVPRGSTTRFRADLGADIVPHALGGEYDQTGTAITPWWGVSSLIGVEVGVPP